MGIDLLGYMIVLMGAYLVVSKWIRSVRYLDGNTYEDYIEAHPKCIEEGAVRCHWCGGRHLALMRDTRVYGFANRHLCTQCGSELYRSRAPR